MTTLLGRVPCAFLATLWLATVITLTQFCVTEFRILKAERAGVLIDVTGSSFDSDQPWSTDDDELNESPLVALLHRVRENNQADDGPSERTEAVNDMGKNSSLATTTPYPAINAHQHKGHLIIHVGPSKTATTSLQTDLTKALDDGWLGNDVVYVGRYYRPFTRDGSLLLNRSESSILLEARKMFHPTSSCLDPTAQCCLKFVEELTPVENKTVIVSDEAFANMWTTPAHFQALREAIPQGWKVTIVATYRRFYDWILSSKYQRDRTDRISQYGKVMWPSDGGRPLLPVFPYTFQYWRQWYHYTDLILENAEGSFPVSILNLHNRSTTFRSQFLCKLQISAACRESLHLDSEPPTVLNSQDETTIPSLFYDAIATSAFEAGMIAAPNASRAQVREDIRHQHEVVCRRHPNDFPLQCPSADELQTLLDLSLSLERKFSSSFRDEMAHVDGFWEKVEAKQYCWVNTTTILDDQQWIDFFAEAYTAN